jgi:hypothetical protein
MGKVVAIVEINHTGACTENCCHWNQIDCHPNVNQISIERLRGEREREREKASEKVRKTTLTAQLEMTGIYGSYGINNVMHMYALQLSVNLNLLREFEKIEID